MRIRMAMLGTALLALSVAACGGGEEQGAKPASEQAAKPATRTVKLSDSSLGKILTDDQGRTLYAFTDDKNKTSSCADACIATWPALLAGKEVKAGEGLQASLLTRTERAEGTMQATYGDWPLYYYAGDANPGEVNGQGVDGVWFVVKSDGKLEKKEAS